jgi:hypothetical protein
MRARSIRILLGSLSLVLTCLATVPLTAAHAASPSEAEAKGAVSKTDDGSIVINRIIPGRCEYTSAEPTVRRGSSGAAVRQAQCEYNWATTGTNIAIDGSFGSITHDAIVRFQQCVGIEDDGIVGPVTWSHLNYWAASNFYPPGC